MKKLILLGLVVIGVGGSFNGCANQAPNGFNSSLARVVAEEIDNKEKRCDGGDANFCFRLGDEYKNGRNVKQDYSKVVEYYEKACDLGMSKGCFYLGRMYGHGMYGMNMVKEPIGIKPDKVKARGFLKKACDGKNSNDKYTVKGCKDYNKMK